MASNDMCTICYAEPKTFECDKCNAIACLQCLQNYLLSSHSPCCFACQNPWTTSYLSEITSEPFVLDKLYPHYDQIIIEREMRMIEVSAKAVEKIALLLEEKARLETLPDDGPRRERMAVIQNDVLCLRAGYPLDDLRSDKHETVITLPKCLSEECQGRLKGDVCDTCQKVFCLKCGAEKKDDHKCNEADVLTMKAIEKDTRRCPSCGVSIQRISGCPQMFCTSCKGAFDWNTLKTIPRHNIHNPHYYEWMASQIKEQGGQDTEEDEPGYSRIRLCQLISSLRRKSIPKELTMKLLGLHRRLNHIWDYRRTPHDARVYEGYRRDFLQNRISENEWIAQILYMNRDNRHIEDYNSKLLRFREKAIQFFHALAFDEEMTHDKIIKTYSDIMLEFELAHFE
jgi:hypothetical protein